jgi:hypothetical protein
LLAGTEVTAKVVERHFETIGADPAAREQQEIRRAKQLGLVRGICGSLIRSNGAGKVGSRSRRTRCRWGVGFFSVASCLSNQFELPGKPYAVRTKPLARRTLRVW